MEEKEAKPRVTGDKTRNAIILAARELFVELGFSGTSLMHIAEKSFMNKSLILHHFKTKENLWKLVKASFLETIPSFELLPKNKDIVSFIQCLVKERFTLYDKNPALARMISWQRLENNTTNLEKMGKIYFEQFITIIEDFQRDGQVRKDLDAKLVSLWIAVSISGIFLIQEKPFKNKQQKQMYQDMIIQSILNMLN